MNSVWVVVAMLVIILGLFVNSIVFPKGWKKGVAWKLPIDCAVVGHDWYEGEFNFNGLPSQLCMRCDLIRSYGEQFNFDVPADSPVHPNQLMHEEP